ncbi:hypothetical protein niasHS_008629 [Heterodera schachtii]|uniref:BTB domain-containing protein n=1 Tax=Heterodera schachtii TaxID=97005 RepID=A0ABD2J067_HETSC
MAVEVPDVEPKAFQVMLSFIYSGDLDDLNGDNAMAVLYAAHNLRQMLGPALFKIRFPFIKKMQFWEKIIPSGVLIAEEAIGVELYQSQTNFPVISHGLPYSLQFPSHGRIWTKWTLLMDIEKASEFEREFHCRYNKSVPIRGLLWKIRAQTKSKNGSTDERWLRFFLCCAASKNEYWRCVCSATFRIVFAKEWSGEFHREIRTDQKWLGFYLWCAAAEKGRREAKRLTSSRTDIEAENWNFKCSATLRIVSQKSDRADFSRDFSGQIFNELSNKSGFSNFITFTELMNPSKGFYDKDADKVKLSIDFIVKEADT